MTEHIIRNAGDYLQQARLVGGLTQGQLAAQTGLSIRRIQRLEWGTGQLKAEELDAIRKVLTHMDDDHMLTCAGEDRAERQKKAEDA